LPGKILEVTEREKARFNQALDKTASFCIAGKEDRPESDKDKHHRKAAFFSVSIE
jgi:hypothetical protein